jgi:hypothetical protein
VQTPSDTTFRVWDWDRNDPARPLHLAEARACVKFGAAQDDGVAGVVRAATAPRLEAAGMTTKRLCKSSFFTVESIEAARAGAIPISATGVPEVWMTLRGHARWSTRSGAVEAPAGATVVFDGKGVEKLEGGKMTPDGLLMQGVTSKDSFGDATWHIEFRLPYQPKDRGQGRGNSGAYIQGAYEIQMLDSFGLEGLNNECGGVYSVAAPAVNMCYPPLQWQTYDIDFTAPKYDGDKKASPARMTVRHNGVVIHNNVAVNQITPGGTGGDDKRVKGPLHLQDHGNPVRYRNIWVQPKP